MILTDISQIMANHQRFQKQSSQASQIDRKKYFEKKIPMNVFTHMFALP